MNMGVIRCINHTFISPTEVPFGRFCGEEIDWDSVDPRRIRGAPWQAKSQDAVWKSAVLVPWTQAGACNRYPVYGCVR